MPVRENIVINCCITLYNTGARAYTNAFFGPGIGPIYLDDFLCRGNEDRLIDCPNGGLNTIDFCNGHADDAGLRCAESKNLYLVR